MLLAIDCGNTNVVFAVYVGDEHRGQWRAATDQSRTADDYAVWLPSLMAMKDLQPSDITHAIIATVVPQALFDLKAIFPANPWSWARTSTLTSKSAWRNRTNRGRIGW